MAMGTSQAPTEAIVATLKGTPYDTGLDLAALDKICKYFTPLREEYIKSGLLDPKVLKVDVQLASFIRFPAECFQTSYLSSSSRERAKSSQRFLKRFRE